MNERNAEKALGFPLTWRSTGGKSGGGSTLTPEGKEWLKKYEQYHDACVQANSRLYLGNLFGAVRKNILS